MSQLQRGETFVDGQVVTAARLNNLVDLAIALRGLVLDQPVSVVSVNDQLLLWDDTTNSLRRVTASALSAVGVTSVGLTMPGPTFNISGPNPIITTGTFTVSWQTQPANAVLCGPVSGAAGTPAFRSLNADDMTIPTVTIASANIDWNLGHVFSKSLTANTTFIFSNPNEGQRIVVKLHNTASFTVTWPALINWPGGIAHTMTAGLGSRDIITFYYIDGLYFGTFNKDFH